jgi:hypothetical protein
MSLLTVYSISIRILQPFYQSLLYRCRACLFDGCKSFCSNAFPTHRARERAHKRQKPLFLVSHPQSASKCVQHAFELSTSGSRDIRVVPECRRPRQNAVRSESPAAPRLLSIGSIASAPAQSRHHHRHRRICLLTATTRG